MRQETTEKMREICREAIGKVTSSLAEPLGTGIANAVTSAYELGWSDAVNYLKENGEKISNEA